MLSFKGAISDLCSLVWSLVISAEIDIEIGLGEQEESLSDERFGHMIRHRRLGDCRHDVSLEAANITD